MALDDLLDRLRRDTDDQVAGLLAAAREAATRLAGDSTCSADRHRAERMALLQQEHQSLLAHDSEATRRKGMFALLEARRSAIGRVLDRVGELLPGAIDAAPPEAVVGAAVDEAMRVLGDRPGVLTAGPAITRLVRNRFSPPPDSVDDPALHGFVLRSADGRLEIDGTMEERLRRMAPGLSIELVRRLEEFG